jgi:putative ABC transport system permease protein
VAFSALAITMSGLVVGFASAMRGARRDLGTSMREGGRGAGTARRQRAIQEMLVAGEVAVSLVLVVGAGLLLQSFQRLRAVDPGIESSGVTTMLVVASYTKYSKPEQQRAIFGAIVERVTTLPGVAAVGLCDCRPPDEVRQSGSLVIDPTVAISGERPPVVDQARVGANYFAALGIPIVAGRAFTDADRDGSQPVALVSETLARRHLQGGEAGAGALGKRVSLDGENWLTVVGVVADVHYDGLAAPAAAAMYYAFTQYPFPGMFMFVRTSGDPDAVVPAIRRAVLEIDPELPLAQVMTLDARVAASITGARFNTTLLAVFAGLAFVLAAIGIYGVVAYSVTERRHEMGVRMALGAEGRDVVRLVVGRALNPVLLGALVGIGFAIAGARLLDRLLYATDPGHPATYAGAVLLLIAVGAVASYIPGRRAVGDPVAALRAE